MNLFITLNYLLNKTVMKNISFCFLISFLIGCSEPYDDLEKDFFAKSKIEGKIIKSKSITLTSTYNQDVYDFRDNSTVKLSPQFVEIDINIPTYEKVQIPHEKISGCGMTCFDSNTWYSDILLGSKGIEISFYKSNEIIDWCWEAGLPMITGKDKRNWMYNGDSLPNSEGYIQVDREEYKRQTIRRCQGY
ncbi:MAG: hypothetical protein OQL19_16810 [Gammaproteobacteria bacterium]|nr:hypothetical protein [Gammaproteobacteria bacterium]